MNIFDIYRKITTESLKEYDYKNILEIYRKGITENIVTFANESLSEIEKVCEKIPEEAVLKAWHSGIGKTSFFWLTFLYEENMFSVSFNKGPDELGSYTASEAFKHSERFISDSLRGIDAVTYHLYPGEKKFEIIFTMSYFDEEQQLVLKEICSTISADTIVMTNGNTLKLKVDCWR